MPQATGVHASTQDNTSGTLVARGVSEVSGSGDLQTLIVEGNKSTYSATARAALTAVDAPTGGDMTATGFGSAALIDVGNAMTAALSATCDTASKTLSGRLALYDTSGTPVFIGFSEVFTFTSDGTRRLGNATGDFVGMQRFLADLGAARKVKFFVESVSGGSWTITTRPI